MNRVEIVNEYFMWLRDLVCSDHFAKTMSYDKLLMHLHNTEFVYLIPKDQNRAADGVSLRYRFATSMEHLDRSWVLDCLEGPCSVFEMMVGLANRCEKTIMDDPLIGNRTGEWFWGMVSNLGLGAMYDSRFDKRLVHDTVSRFLNREYGSDGKGGLFTVPHCSRDMRDIEIWDQLSYFLGTIT